MDTVNVFAVTPPVKFVAPLTVPPVNAVAVLVLKPVMVAAKLPVPANVIVPDEYVPPVTAFTVVVVGLVLVLATLNTLADDNVTAVTALVIYVFVSKLNVPDAVIVTKDVEE